MRQQQSTSDSVAKTPKGKLAAKTESKEVVKENLDRISFCAVNEGTNTIWFAKGATAVAKEGPFLVTNGALEWNDYTGPIAAITSAGESNLGYCET